jgi:hypothetical protein
MNKNDLIDVVIEEHDVTKTFARGSPDRERQLELLRACRTILRTLPAALPVATEINLTGLFMARAARRPTCLPWAMRRLSSPLIPVLFHFPAALPHPGGHVEESRA